MIRLFKVFVPTSVLALLISEILLIFGAYLAATFLASGPDYDPGIYLFDEYGLARLALVTGVIVAGLYFHDLYTDFRIRSRLVLLQQLCFTIGIAFLVQALTSYARRAWILPKWLMIEGSILALIALYLWRLAFSSTIWKAAGQQRILFLGTSPVVFQIAGHLADHPEFGLTPIGYLEEASGSPPKASKIGRVGYITDVLKAVSDTQPQRIVVGMSDRRERMPVTELLEVRFSGIPIEEIANLYEVIFGRVCTQEIRPSQFIFAIELQPRRPNIRLQSIYMKALVLLALPIVLPLMAVVALVVKFSTPGPILHRQQRVGLNSKLFTVFKFRSMHQNAEVGTGAVWATRNDPRITRAGYWLRKFRLDELPQLFNVLRGDMSIVGPRPERPEFVQMLSEQIPYYRHRHCVMPGITGWAQINYKYGDTIEDTMIKLEYDLYYIKHVSIWLDLIIIFHTAKIMLLVRGAQ